LLEGAQDLRQWAGAQLRASASAGRERCKADLFTREHMGQSRYDLGQRGRTADRRVPNAERKRDEQHGEREVLPRPPAADDDEQEEHGGSGDERKVEQEEQR
jgi:hypothetical protein